MREKELLNDPATSEWLRVALELALRCDAVRAANDANLLRTLLHQRAAREYSFPEAWIPTV